jgi:hypothetical protein
MGEMAFAHGRKGALRIEVETPTTITGHPQQQRRMTRHYDIALSGSRIGTDNDCLISTLHRPAWHSKHDTCRPSRRRAW